jgi:hypothetical protein
MKQKFRFPIIRKVFLLIFSILLVSTNIVYGQNLFGVKKQLWKAQKDDVFLQEVSEKIPTETPVLSVAEYENSCFALIGTEVYLLEGNSLNKVSSAPLGVSELVNIDGNLWAMTNNGIYRLSNKNWQKIDGQIFVDLAVHHGVLHGATREEIFQLKGDEFVSIKPEGGYYSSNVTMLMEDGTQLHADPVRLGPIDKIESYSGTLYILRPGKLVLFDGKMVSTDFIDWGILPSKDTRDMLSFGSRLFISTDRGLSVLRGAALTVLKGEDGLPFKDTKCLKKGFDGDVWIGTSKGAIRMLDNDWHYFGADHWLSGDNVNDIAVGDKVVYVATDAGIGIIRYEPYTLLKKATYYERHIKEWGLQRLGFIHTLSKVGDEWVREISDNDGGHTSPYLAAMCFKYAVTGDEEARQEALNSFYAMVWMERITPIDGYPARAIYSLEGDKGEMAKHGSGGLPAKWFPSPDGKWMWKGDTSSDEIMAHIYSVSIFHDLVAKGEDKELAKEHLVRIATHILENGWVLRGMDGKPTRWGRWEPTYLLRPYGYMDRGINGLEALTFMRTAYGLTGDEKFEEGYQQLVDWGYAANTIRQKNVFPPENIAPWDDNLAFRSYYTLLRNTDDPASRSVYLRSLERTWEVKRIEEIPWYNYVYGAITGNDCEQEQSVKHLREWQLDCVEHNFTNSFRDDLMTKKGYVPYESGTRAISPRESVVNRNSRYSMNYDGGANGKRAMEPSAYIRDYWMGRYHGLIDSPTTDNPDLISVKPRTGQQFGAEPYNGSDRPEIK